MIKKPRYRSIEEQLKEADKPYLWREWIWVGIVAGLLIYGFTHIK